MPVIFPVEQFPLSYNYKQHLPRFNDMYNNTASVVEFEYLAPCPNPFSGIEEHCRLVEGRSKLSKSDEK
jgi:hypothetical protein